MKLRDRKKKESGSALLVVLGFLSFMVVSAVAFAIYMRSERVPSSALRRNVATRHLVKAAMAQAMSRVDDAIRNDPFPGLANTNGNANFYHDQGNNSMDLWFGRVFMPPDPEGLLDDSGANVTEANDPGDLNKFAWRFAPVTETVSVLCLEALGYLPPPLVNDVRFLSRSSYAAKWQNFPFDAGRFAFCAVNVSDYFDINRTKVGVRSSPLDSSISLLETLTLSRTRNPAEDDPDPSKIGKSFYVKTLETADREYLVNLIGPNAIRPTYSLGSGKADTTTEYISMLDYNLAFGKQRSGQIGYICDSPFYTYLKGDRGSLYKNMTFQRSTDNRLNMAMCQPFVTDSFATNETYSVADFSKRSGQPFPDVDMSGDLSFDGAMMKVTSPFLKELRNRRLVPDIFFPVFYDYLDHDDVPLSLAMPSVERVPMVTAVELAKNNFGKLKMVPGTTSKDPETLPPKFTGTQTTTTQFNLHPDSFCGPEPMVRVLLSFPFRHLSQTDMKGKKFDVQVLLKVFSASVQREKMVYRPEAKDVGVLADLRPKDDTEWNDSKPFAIGGEGNVIGYSFCSQPEPVPSKIFDSPDDEEQALHVVEVKSWKSTRDSPVMYTVITRQEYENGSPKGGGSRNLHISSICVLSARTEKCRCQVRSNLAR